MTTKYAPLGKEIKHRGWTYIQVWRDEHAAVYEVYIGSGRICGYEIIAIKKQGENERFGKIYPPKELYPNDEDWGKFGWSWNNKDESIEQGKSVSRQCQKGELRGRLTQQGDVKSAA